MTSGSAPTVVVLAGGSNSRFWPLRGKSLLRFGERTLVQRLIGALADAGCQRFVVVANADTEAALRAQLTELPVASSVVVQPAARGMGDALLCAAAATPSLADGPLLVTQAHDVVAPALYGALVAAGASGVADGWLVGQRVSSYFPGGYLSLDGARVTGLVEKPGAGHEPSDMVSLVLHLHRQPAALLDAIRAAYASAVTTDDHYERALGAVLDRRDYRVLPYDGPWRPIKFPWQVLGVMDLLLGELTPTDSLPEGVSGPVVLEAGVRLFPGARVVGPAWIGAGTVIGNGSLVRGSIIGRQVEIGYGCEIARSYVGDHCGFHHNYVGDSVIEAGTALGFGTVTGNFPFYPAPVRSTVAGERVHTDLDKFGAVIGAGCRTGIGALLYPGVKIGAGSFVGPGVVVTRDVPEGRLLTVEQTLKDQPNPFTWQPGH